MSAVAPGVRAHTAISIAVLLTLGTYWGAATVAAKVVAGRGVPPFGYALWMTSIAGTILLAICLSRGRVPPLSRRHLEYYAVTGLIGSAFPTSVMFFVVSHIPAGIVAVVLATIPLLTYAFALVARIERFDALRALGVLAGLGGALVIVLPKASLPSPDMIPWVLAAFLSPAGYAGQNIYATLRRPPSGDSTALAAGMMLGAAAWLLPAAAWQHAFHPLWVSPGLAEALIVAHGLGSVLAFSLYFFLLKRAGPVYMGQVGYLVTLAGMGFGVAFLGERHSAWVALAVVLIFVGVALVNARQRRVGG